MDTLVGEVMQNSSMIKQEWCFRLIINLIYFNIAHGKRAGGPPRQLGRMGLSERWALVKFVPDKSNDNTQRHLPADSQTANEENAPIFENPTYSFNTDEENQQHDENKQVDGQIVIKPSLRRPFSTDPEDDFSANDINMVGDDLLDSRNMRYYKIRVRRSLNH